MGHNTRRSLGDPGSHAGGPAETDPPSPAPAPALCCPAPTAAPAAPLRPRGSAREAALRGEVRERKQDNWLTREHTWCVPGRLWNGSRRHSNNINNMPNFVNLMPFVGHCMFNGREPHLTVNRGTSRPETRSWTGPGVPTPVCKPVGVFAGERIQLIAGPRVSGACGRAGVC